MNTIDSEHISSGARVTQIYIHKMTINEGKVDVELSAFQKIKAIFGLVPSKKELEDHMANILISKDQV